MGNKRGRKGLNPAYVRNVLVHEKSFYPTEEYQGSTKGIPGVCMKCGYDKGSPTWGNVSRRPGACAECSVSSITDPAHVRNVLIHEKSFYPTEEYQGSDKGLPGVCMKCGYDKGAPTWGNVKRRPGACSSCGGGKGIDYSVPAVLYLVGGVVEGAGPCLKVGIAQEDREDIRIQQHAKNGLDTHLVSVYFPTGYDAKAVEDHLKGLIASGPGSLYSFGLVFDGSTETFELDGADSEFLSELLAHYGITDVPLFSLWTDENYRSRFEAWSSFALAA